MFACGELFIFSSKLVENSQSSTIIRDDFVVPKKTCFLLKIPNKKTILKKFSTVARLYIFIEVRNIGQNFSRADMKSGQRALFRAIGYYFLKIIFIKIQNIGKKFACAFKHLTLRHNYCLSRPLRRNSGFGALRSHNSI